MNRPRLSPLLRLQFLGLLMLLGLGALAVRLWWVQVARGAEWTARIRGSSEATVRIPSIRGEIRDRNGVPLVQNRASYEVDFYLPEMVKGYRQRYGQPPITDYRGKASGMPKDLKEPDIVKIVNDGIVPRLDDLDLARDYNAGQLQKHYRTNTKFPTPTSRTLIFRRWRSFPSTMSDCLEWTLRSSRCALTSMARSRPISWATSVHPMTPTKRKRASSLFTRAMWMGNRISRKYSTSI